VPVAFIQTNRSQPTTMSSNISQTGKFFPSKEWARECSLADDLSPGAKALMNVMANAADDAGVCDEAIPQLAASIPGVHGKPVSRASIDRWRAEAISSGRLERLHRSRGRPPKNGSRDGYTSRFQLLADRLGNSLPPEAGNSLTPEQCDAHLRLKPKGTAIKNSATGLQPDGLSLAQEVGRRPIQPLRKTKATGLGHEH
jgi:hypothetical protein